MILLGKLESEGATEVEEEEVVAVTPAVVVPATVISSRYGLKGGGGRYGSVAPPSSTIPTPSIPIHLTSKSRYSIAQPIRTRQPTASSSSTSQESDSPGSLSNSLESLPSSSSCPPPTLAQTEQDEDVLSRYVEERYGRNLDLSLAPLAKLAMRRRIAGVLRESEGNSTPVEMVEVDGKVHSNRGVEALTEKDVWLYPTGMSAIFHAHQLVMAAKAREGGPAGKSICFGCVARLFLCAN